MLSKISKGQARIHLHVCIDLQNVLLQVNVVFFFLVCGNAILKKNKTTHFENNF